MVAFPIRQRLILPLAPLFAVVAAAAVALLALLLPSPLLDAAVMASGLPAVLPAAAPPLGLNARLAMMITGGGAAAALAWFAAYLAFGGRTVALSKPAVRAPRAVAAPRRAPAEPSRAPLIATRDLGTPFLEVKAKPQPPVERSLPKNLDVPLANFDPAAVPAIPARPAEPVAPLVRPAASQPALAPGERIDAFVLPTPIAAPETEATIHALLERLERGISRREPSPPVAEAELADAAAHVAGGIESTLGELRRLAATR